MNENHRILYLRPGYVPPPSEPEKDEFYHLSDKISGDVLNPVWDTDLESPLVRKAFTYHLFRSWYYPKPLRLIADILFYITKGLSLHFLKNQKYHAIVSYGTYKTGISALVLKYITGAKLIIDVPGNPSRYFISHEKIPSFFSRIKHHTGLFLFRMVARRADMLKLLYPTQLDQFPKLKVKPQRIFFAITPVPDHEQLETSDDNFIFFLGSPWYLKGVDILIQAFQKIKDDFPSITLKIVGHTSDAKDFIQLANNDSRIEFMPQGIPNAKALEIFSRCTLFVLPSRTEAMGRVLLEAMAFKKPVIGSNVDGIPTVIRDGYNGLLFENENMDDLAEKMRAVLENPGLAKELGENGKTFVQNETSNERYVELFHEMVKDCCT